MTAGVIIGGLFDALEPVLCPRSAASASVQWKGELGLGRMLAVANVFPCPGACRMAAISKMYPSVHLGIS